MPLGFFHYKKISRKIFQKNFDKYAFFGAIIIPLVTIPQLFKIIIAKSAGSVSLIAWTAYLAGALFWLVYGLVHKERVIIVAYTLSVIIYGLVVAAIVVY